MRKIGWTLIVLGIIAFLGAASKGHSVFGPAFWIGVGGLLVYLKRERTAERPDESGELSSSPKADESPRVVVETTSASISTPNVPLSFEQKKAAICLIAFFSGFNEDVAYSEKALLLANESAKKLGVNNYREIIASAMYEFQDVDTLMDTILTIKDVRSKEIILSTCCEMAVMSKQFDAMCILRNVAREMGYSKEKIDSLIKNYQMM